MGGVVGKVALVALGAAIGAAAVEAARAAAEAVFEAINEAAKAASRYMSALHRAATSAAAEAYEVVQRVVAGACEAVTRAAACVSRRLFVLIECVHGFLAASFAKRELDCVSGLVGAGDVASLVAAIVDGIKRLSKNVSPEQPFGQFAPAESPKARRVASSAAKIMELVGLISSAAAVCERLGLKVPTAAKVAVSVIGVAAQLVFDFLLS